MLTGEDIKRFVTKIKEYESCLEWNGHVMSNGYGQFGVGRKIYLAHRIAWIIRFGEIPDGLFVLHKCDNRKCVNVDHLFLGTAKDNYDDAVNKSRIPPSNIQVRGKHRGEKHHSHKLTEAAVIEIRANYKPFVYTQRMLSEKYGVSQRAIEDVISRRRWAHV